MVAAGPQVGWRAARLPSGVVAVATLLGAGLAFNAAHSLGLGGHRLDSLANDWIYNGLIVGAAAVCLAGSRRADGRRRAWMSLGAGIGSWAVGEILYSVLYGQGDAPIPSVSDPFWLGFYPCAWFAIALLARELRPPFDLDLWLDGAIVATAAAALAAVMLVEPVISATGGSVTTVAINLAYPLADVLLLGMVVWTFALSRWQPARVLVLLGAGLVTASIADSLYLYRTAAGTYEVGTLLDTLWPGAMLLLAAAAWAPDVPVPATARRSWRVPVVAAVAGVSSLGVLVYGDLAEIGWLALAFASLSVALVIVRAGRAARARADAEAIARLQNLTEAALEHVSLNSLLGDLLARIRRHLRVDAAAVLLLEPGSDRLTHFAGTGSGEAPPTGASVGLGEGFAGRVLRARRLLVAAEPEIRAGRYPDLDLRLGRAVGVPLLVDDTAIGVLWVGRDQPLRFTEQEQGLLRLVADRTALAIDRARLYEREHGIAETLQRTLLPDRLPSLPGIDLAARYLPGGAGTVGGDWYDVVPLPSGGLGLLMGDVAGRGIPAAALMGQLRNAARAYALDDPSPGYVLGRLNRLLDTLGDEYMATAIYVLFEPGSWRLRLAGAGHLPPIIVAPDGTVQRVEGVFGLPLGAAPTARFDEISIAMDPGSAVLLYTDGLVERRGEALETGLDRLMAAIPAHHDAAGVCDRIVEELLPLGATADDAALLLMQTAKLAADTLRLRMPAEPRTLASMRSALRRWLEAAGVEGRSAYGVVLAANEAAANAIEHAYPAADSEFELTATTEGHAIVVSVRDWGRWRPPRGQYRGHGLQLMKAMMDEVRVERRGDGTTVFLRRSARQAATA